MVKTNKNRSQASSVETTCSVNNPLKTPTSRIGPQQAKSEGKLPYANF